MFYDFEYSKRRNLQQIVNICNKFENFDDLNKIMHLTNTIVFYNRHNVFEMNIKILNFFLLNKTINYIFKTIIYFLLHLFNLFIHFLIVHFLFSSNHSWLFWYFEIACLFFVLNHKIQTRSIVFEWNVVIVCDFRKLREFDSKLSYYNRWISTRSRIWHSMKFEQWFESIDSTSSSSVWMCMKEI